MPLTLWRHTFFEVARLVALTAAVLVAVVAFAAAVKPLADGKLEPADALVFMLLAIPPMLAYALPFASGFGATLAYHRFASENEFLAAHAGGVSHRALLVPALTAGVVLGAGLLVMNEFAIPRFLRKMEELVTLDMGKLMVGSIGRNESVRLGELSIYADDAARLDPDPNAGILDQFLLTGVWAVEFDENDDIAVDVAVRYAQVSVMTEPAAMTEAARAGQRWPDANPNADPSADPNADPDNASDTDRHYAVIRLMDGDGIANGQAVSFRELPPIFEPLDDAFQDDPKFLTFGELRELAAHPLGMNWIRRDHHALAQQLAVERLATTIGGSLASDRGYILTDASGRLVTIRNARVDANDGSLLLPLDDMATSPTPRIEVRLADAGQPDAPRMTAYAEQARLVPSGATGDGLIASGSTSSGLRLDLELTGVRVVDTSAAGLEPIESERDALLMTRLRPEFDPLDALAALPADELLAEAAPSPAGSAVASLADRLSSRIAKLQREIFSKQQERLAMSAACTVMIVLGAVTAIRLRESVPLKVYLWSFFPALACVLLISTGQQAVHRGGVTMLPVLWSGVLGLALIALLTLRKVALR
jgi:lipopolysaccharide export LptBFGC system permease protein LptF